MINVVFAILMISNGSIIEYVPVNSLGACLEEKRKITRSIGENQEGIYMQCKEVEAEIYEDCVADVCRTKIKRIIEEWFISGKVLDFHHIIIN